MNSRGPTSHHHATSTQWNSARIVTEFDGIIRNQSWPPPNVLVRNAQLQPTAIRPAVEPDSGKRPST
jgi:hypothetical protein